MKRTNITNTGKSRFSGSIRGPMSLILNQLRSAKLLLSLAIVGLCCHEGATEAITLTDAITLTAESQLEPRRQLIRKVIWGATSIPSSQAIPQSQPTNNCLMPAFINLSKVQELRIPMDLIEGLACHFVAASPNGRLVIYNPGHANTVADKSSWTTDESSSGYGDQRAIQALLSDGYGVLLTFMPQYRPDDVTPASHQGMFKNWQPATGSVWRYFIEPISASLNYVQNNSVSGAFPSYTEFDMLGLSGGGWTTTVYAAIDPRIKISVQVAGSEPLEFWGGNGEDDEQTLSALYKVAAYRDLYTLGAAGAGRRQVQILNRRDNCCFFPGWRGMPSSSWESSIRSYESAVKTNLLNMGDSGAFRLEIDDASVRHQISRNAMANVVLPELEGGRQHVGAASAADAFVRGANAHMWHWSAAGWEDTGLPMVGVPAVVLNSTHSLDVFYRDPGNNLQQAWKNGSVWTSKALGGVIVSDPAAASWGPGRFDVVAFGGNYVLYHWSSAQTGYDTPVASRQGVATPTIVSAGTNSLDVVFRDLNAGVTHVFWNGANWDSESLGGLIRGMPGAVVTPGPALRVYALGTDQRLYEQAKVGSGTWSGWVSVSNAAGVAGTILGGSPHAVLRSSDSVATVHARTSDNRLGLFTRPSSWSFTAQGAAGSFRGSPTPVPSGGSWALGISVNDLLLFDGTSFSSKGGVIE
jgi:hypothetical protein